MSFLCSGTRHGQAQRGFSLRILEPLFFRRDTVHYPHAHAQGNAYPTVSSFSHLYILRKISTPTGKENALFYPNSKKFEVEEFNFQ